MTRFVEILLGLDSTFLFSKRKKLLAMNIRLILLTLMIGYLDVTIYFNDPNIVGVKPWPGHNDHLHVGFK